MRDVDYIKYLRAEAVAKGFSFPAKFKKTNSGKMAKLYNGIGAEWMPKLLVRIITYICDRLEAPALVHDFEYSMKPKTYWRFTVANVRFAYNSAKCRRPVLGIAGAVICQLFGWWAFKNGKEIKSEF